MPKQMIYEFGDFSLNQTEQKLLRNNEIVYLTPKAFEALTFLIKNNGHLIEKTELLEEVWKGTIVEESNLNVVIHTLRKALGDDPKKSRYIETVSKRGYRFVAEVEAKEIPDSKPEPNNTAQKEVVEANNESPVISKNGNLSVSDSKTNFIERPDESRTKPYSTDKIGKTGRLSGRFGVLIVVFSVLLSGFLIYLLYKKNNGEDASIAQASSIKSIAVLPFRVLSDEKDDEYLSIGLADALITSLSQTKQVIVRQTESVAKYQNSGKDSLEAGREQGVDAVLDGQIQRIDDHIRVTVRLIRTSDGSAIWADRFDTQFTNIFAVEDEISEKVAGITVRQIENQGIKNSDRLTKRYTANNDAYKAYLKGRYFWNKRTSDSLQKALLSFQEAIKLDPNFSIAYVGLADTYTLMSFFTLMSPQEAFPKAREAAEKALSIDDSLAEAHTALGQVKAYYEWDWLGAEEQFKEGIALNPNSPLLHHWRSLNLLAMGRMSEARAAMRRSLELDPLLLITNVNLGRIDYYQKNYDAAMVQFKKALELDRHFTRAHFRLGMTYMQKGDYEKSLKEYRQVNELVGETSQVNSYIAYMYAISDNRKEADNRLEQLKNKSNGEYVSPYSIALVYVGLGEKDKAFEYLNKAFEDHSTEMIYFKVDPLLEPLHSDKRYGEILQKMNLADNNF